MTTWTERDLPVLRAVFELSEKAGPHAFVDVEPIAEHVALDRSLVLQSLDLLQRDGLVDADFALGGSAWASGLTPEGLRRLGEWPTGSELAAALPEILRALAEKESDSTKASVLKRGADILQGLVVGTATAVIKEVTGIG